MPCPFIKQIQAIVFNNRVIEIYRYSQDESSYFSTNGKFLNRGFALKILAEKIFEDKAF